MQTSYTKRQKQMSDDKNECKPMLLVLPGGMPTEAIESAKEFFAILSKNQVAPLNAIAACSLILTYIERQRGISKGQILGLLEGFYDYCAEKTSDKKMQVEIPQAKTPQETNKDFN